MKGRMLSETAAGAGKTTVFIGFVFLLCAVLAAGVYSPLAAEGDELEGLWVNEDCSIEFVSDGSFLFTEGDEVTRGRYELKRRNEVADVDSAERVLYLTEGIGGRLTPLYITDLEVRGGALEMGLMFKDGSGRQARFSRAV